MVQHSMESIKTVLQPYGVEPYFLESFGKVHKVYSNKGTLAIKEIETKKGVDFVRNIHYLYQRGYNNIVPIFPTQDGRYAVWSNDRLYYIMPWLANEEKENRVEKNQMLFRELARMHTLSSKEVEINKEERNEHYEMLTSRWEKEQQFLEEYVEQCENSEYMSPFQLYFCMYYNELTQALKYSQRKFNEWYEESKENEKVRTVIIHGKLSNEHYLFDERGKGYMHNFEGSKVAAPFHDLLPFLTRTLKNYPKPYDECLEWLNVYFQHFSFRKEEMQLFLSYLAYPSSLIAITERYYHTPVEKRNEQRFVRKLQRYYWFMKNTEYVVMQLEEIERKKKEQEEKAKEEAAE